MQSTFSFKVAYKLTVILTVVAAITAACGVLFPDLYRDSATIKKAWLGNDLVTLFIVVPALLVVVKYARKGAIKAVLVWLGLLSYLFYNYAFYLFGAAFNKCFLFYIILFVLPLYTAGFLLSTIRTAVINDLFIGFHWHKAISVYLLLVAMPLGVFEISQYLLFVFKKQLPQAPTLVLALDLSFVIPAMILAAILLWQRNVWGVIVGAIMLTKGVTYGLVLIVASVLVGFSAEGEWDALLRFYLFVFLGSLVGVRLLLQNSDKLIKVMFL